MNKKLFLKGIGALLLSIIMMVGGVGATTAFAASPFSDVSNYSKVIYQNISVTSGGTASKITDINDQKIIMDAAERIKNIFYTEEKQETINWHEYWFCSQQDRNSIMVCADDVGSYGYIGERIHTYMGPDSKEHTYRADYYKDYNYEADQNKDSIITFGEYLDYKGVVDYDYDNLRALIKQRLFLNDGSYRHDTATSLYAFRLENADEKWGVGVIDIESEQDYQYSPSQLGYSNGKIVNNGANKYYIVYKYDEISTSWSMVGKVHSAGMSGTFETPLNGDGLYIVVGLFNWLTPYGETTNLNGFDISKIMSGVDGTMYRMYNPISGEHFYTANVEEANHLKEVGWYYEGQAWISPTTSDMPVYRLYNPNSGEHHYTTSEVERDSLDSIGWNFEGIGWYSASDEGTPLYRLYNPNAKGTKEAGSHHYTKDAGERDYLVSIGWNDEGIGWYGN